MVFTIIEGTDAVPPARRWDFWHATAMPSVQCAPIGERDAFAARRLVAQVAGTAAISTASSPVQLRRTRADIARNGIDAACVILLTAGHGILDQAGREATVSAGGLLLYDLGRPHAAAVPEGYREIRLHVPRATFAARVGRIETLAGLVLPSGDPLVALFTSYLVGYVAALPELTTAAAETGLDGLLHLLSGLVATVLDRQRDGGAALARDALLALADRAIQGRLADPALDVAGMARALGVSRTRLYEAFADRGGIAAAIREARLERAALRLADPADRHRTLEEIARACGFTDYPTFTRAFRRRFGASPRDWRAG